MPKASRPPREPAYLVQFRPLAEAMARLLFPYAEIVIHDLATNKIVLIENPVSKRTVGDPADLEGFDPATTSDVIGTYEKVNWDGRRMKSVSAVLRDAAGEAVALLCINLDVEDFFRASEVVRRFLSPPSSIEKPAALFQNDLLDKINSYVHSYLQERKRSLATLSLEERAELVRSMYATGAFSEPRAASLIAKVLGLSRATVYNYLKRPSAATLPAATASTSLRRRK